MPDGIDATVIYYGHLITDREELAKLDSPVLGLFGADDGAIPPDQVHAFEEALEELGKPVEINIYDGAGHAFANPSGERYARRPPRTPGGGPSPSWPRTCPARPAAEAEPMARQRALSSCSPAPWSRLLLASAACRGGVDEAPPKDDEGPGQSYTVRGEVVAVPGGGGPTDQLRIRHEPIPDFVGFDGDVVGMSSMTMPFPTADSVDLAVAGAGGQGRAHPRGPLGGLPRLPDHPAPQAPARHPADFRKVDTESDHADPEHSGTSPGDAHDPAPEVKKVR